MEEPAKQETKIPTDHIFTGNIYIFHAFDVGDDVNFTRLEQLKTVATIPVRLPKYFKDYHTPVSIEPPSAYEQSHCISNKLYNFGAISLTYQVPFRSTLKDLRKNFSEINIQYLEQSVADAKVMYKRIEKAVAQPTFFQTRSSYIIIQLNPDTTIGDVKELQRQYGGIIASTLRFETETLSEEQKNDILETAMGYFRGDLIIIDIDATFVYDAEYEEILDFFEFANIQQLELRFFDRLLTKKLQAIYEKGLGKLPFKSTFPFIGRLSQDPVVELGRLRADISVITERLEGSIKFAGEPYFSTLYQLLMEKLDLNNWRNAIDRKLTIIHDIQTIVQHKSDVSREDMLSMLVVALIFIELVIGILNYIK